MTSKKQTYSKSIIVCNTCLKSKPIQTNLYKKYTNSSQYMDNLNQKTVSTNFQRNCSITNNNQSSDRVFPSNSKVKFIYKTLPKLQPGKLNPGGIGVDIKHNSYNRYLLKKKGLLQNIC